MTHGWHTFCTILRDLYVSPLSVSGTGVPRVLDDPFCRVYVFVYVIFYPTYIIISMFTSIYPRISTLSSEGIPVPSFFIESFWKIFSDVNSTYTSKPPSFYTSVPPVQRLRYPSLQSPQIFRVHYECKKTSYFIHFSSPLYIETFLSNPGVSFSGTYDMIPDN